MRGRWILRENTIKNIAICVNINMEKKGSVCDICAEELAAFASSLAISLSKNATMGELCTLRTFFAALSSNIGLIETQRRCQKDNKK